MHNLTSIILHPRGVYATVNCCPGYGNTLCPYYIILGFFLTAG